MPTHWYWIGRIRDFPDCSLVALVAESAHGGKTDMILCHKCKGVLAVGEENDKGLLGCSCISGYVRGFEPYLTREQAIAEQIQAQRQWIDLYTRQGRTETEIQRVREKLAALEVLGN